MPQPFIKNVPAISSMYLANTSLLKQMQIFKERFHFGNKNENRGLNLYINNISSAYNQLKIMQQFLKFRQHLVKVCLFLKLFSTNTLVRASYLYLKKNNSKKNKFKKIKFYNKLLNNMFFKKQKKNHLFFVLKKHKIKNKFQKFKINFKALKKDLKFINKSFYLNLFFKTNKIFYLNFFVDKYNLNKKKMINTLTKSLCNYSTVFVDTQKKVNIMNFNKFYLLNAGHLLNYKKFNFFFNNPFCMHNTNVLDSISFKQTTLYFRYVIAHLIKIKKKNSNFSKGLVSGQTKTKLNLKKNRKTYLTNVFTFLKLKRFLFFNLTLSFF